MKLIKNKKEETGRLQRFTPPSGRWPPLWPLSQLRSDIERLFEEPFSDWLAPTPGLFGDWGPPVDVFEDKNNVIVKVEIPGMKKEEIAVDMVGEMLNISGERKEEAEYKGAGSYRSERYFGHFHRSVSLPAAVQAEKIDAHYKDGVLTITCPKTEEAKRKQIEIKVD